MFSELYLQNGCSHGREALSFEFGVAHLQLPCARIQPKRNITILVWVERGERDPQLSS